MAFYAEMSYVASLACKGFVNLLSFDKHKKM